jgi:SAM-dependent methyltransferase
VLLHAGGGAEAARSLGGRWGRLRMIRCHDRIVSLERFVLEHLPPAPSRVLEVGCGTGELALGLSAAGYRIVAIDPEAPEGEIFRRVQLEEFKADRPFDAVVASRSLHHIEELRAAVDRIADLLRPGGVLAVNEHAWDRLDERTARWYLRQLTARDPGAPASLAACLGRWRQDHAGLHGYPAMRRALDRRFAERYFRWLAYLHGELGEPSLEAEERRLIDAGEIEATGFRYVGARQ